MGVFRNLLLPMALAALAPRARAQDADSIVARAIRRRADNLARLGRARYQAEVKFVVRDAGLPSDSAGSIVLIAETRASAYWETGGDYLETILARRRSGGQGAGHGLASIAEIANIERDRIELQEYAPVARAGQGSGRSGGRNRARPGPYAIVSPLAPAAPTYYDYGLLDSGLAGGRLVYRVSLRPRTDAMPLLSGTMEVADSTWDVLAIEADVVGAVPFGAAENLRYEERFAAAGDGSYLPSLIRLTGEVRPRLSSERVPREVAGFRLPGVPRHLLLEHVAALDSFRFEPGDRPADAGEYRVVVSERADRPDSEPWSNDLVPLTDAERTALARADSADRHPGTISRMVKGAGAAAELVGNPGFFHYNRVDGTYVGAAQDWRAGPGLELTTAAGYGTGSGLWQYRVGGQIRLSESRRLWVGAWYRDETLSWPSLVSSGYNSTFRAFFARTDPHNYYRERGVELLAVTRLLDRTRLELRYIDAVQSTLDTVPGPAAAASSRWPPLPNPPIVDGHLRSLGATLSWDSRAMVRSGGRDYRLGGRNWTHASVAVEVAAPSVIPDDFFFRRYTLQVEHQQQWPPGSTLIALAAGVATGEVPPQRYFTVDFGMGVLAADGIGFNTMYRTSYSGNRALMLVARHDFGRQLFTGSGLPLLRSLPFTLSLHGGAFWTDFADHMALPADTVILTAPAPYSEVGFALGNLTPFLSPINFSVGLSWQLSSYPTRSFRLGLGFTGP